MSPDLTKPQIRLVSRGESEWSSMTALWMIPMALWRKRNVIANSSPRYAVPSKITPIWWSETRSLSSWKTLAWATGWDQLGQAWGIKNWELEPALEKIRKYSCLWVKKAMDYKHPLKEGWHRWESTLRAQCASSSESLYQTKDEPQEAQEQSDLVLNHHWAQLEA